MSSEHFRTAAKRENQTRRTIEDVRWFNDGAPNCCIALRVSQRRIASTRATTGSQPGIAANGGGLPREQDVTTRLPRQRIFSLSLTFG
jgi:hypothetical protein